MAIQQRSDNERLRAFGFLFAPYKPEYWWFEVFECCRRVTLASIPVLVLGSSTIQVVLATAVCFTALVVLVATKPYFRQLDNMYACGAQLALFLVCFIGTCDGCGVLVLFGLHRVHRSDVGSCDCGETRTGLLLKYGEASADSKDIEAVLMVCANTPFATVVAVAVVQRLTGVDKTANRSREADAVM
jgi:hypothetical protein